MATTTLAVPNSNTLICNLSLPDPLRMSRPHRRTSRSSPRPKTTVSASSSRNGNHHNGAGRSRSAVDEDMIVLRQRIHEMKAAEEGGGGEPPAHWMEWEKKCYAGKDEFVCDLTGLLQTWMMEARPGLVLGAILVVALSVPAAGAAASWQMLAVMKGVLLRLLAMHT